MANKRASALRKLDAQKVKSENEKAKLKIFDVIALVCVVAVLLCFFVNWVEIFNTGAGIGVEANVTGFGFATAGVSGMYTYTGNDFKGTGGIEELAVSVIGDYMPAFNYYAQPYCLTMGVLTLIAAIMLVACIVLKVICVIDHNDILSYVAFGALAASALLILACFITALSINNTDMIAVYCSGNPACSLRSYAIIPAVIAFIGAGVEMFLILKHRSLSGAKS